MKEGGIVGLSGLTVSFIDSEGKDLVEGIPTMKWETYTVQYTGDFVYYKDCPVKLFINDEETPWKDIVSARLVYKQDRIEPPYDALIFLSGYFGNQINDPSHSTVYTVRYEIVCPYLFGNEQVHTLVGELSRWYPGGYYWFQKCWFDGVEASPVYNSDDMGNRQIENTYIVQLDR
jgi:hypothetical protein